MKTYSISKAAHLFGLSRSTLLYYDRVGLLSPSSRTPAGYRIYTDQDVKLLERICNLRGTGLCIEDIMKVLRSGDDPRLDLLERRLVEIGREIDALRTKQKLLSAMLKGFAVGEGRAEVDKKMWVEMLHAAGMDEQGMERWHSEFEHRAPEAHRNFLLSLGIPEDEVKNIRQWSRDKPSEGGNTL
ncbi:MAG: MerR family transcriptional regulator [Desulfobacteraceae bacterium]|nr:MerR family transcriptional regulator [Desulfobacteraceae bacterium]